MEQPDLKTTVIDMLMGTKREGIDKVVGFLTTSDFFTAPASTIYHGNYEGGLMTHSLYVYDAMCKMQSILSDKSEEIKSIPNESIIITSILHDVCKIGFYEKGTIRRKNPDTNEWESIMGYRVNDRFPMGHGEKSLILLLNSGLKLSVEEMMAIRWHQGFSDVNGMSVEEKCAYNKAIETYPIITLLQLADTAAAFIYER